MCIFPRYKTIQILAYYEGSQTYNDTGGGDPVIMKGTNITADRPVLFTVSVDIRELEGTEIAFIGSLIDIDTGALSDYMLFKYFTGTDGPCIYETITFPATNMAIGCAAPPPPSSNHVKLRWHIMVMGTPGTDITVKH